MENNNSLPEETWLDLNAQTLTQLECNFPAATHVQVCWKENDFVSSVNWTEKGATSFGDNTQLKAIKFRLEEDDNNGHGDDNVVDMDNLKAFCEGLAANRSVERLHIINCPYMADLMERLVPFVEENRSLCRLAMNSCGLPPATTRLLTAALSNRGNKSSLSKLELESNMIGGQEAAGLIESLTPYCNLVSLSLGGNDIGVSGCVALGELLERPRSGLRELRLDFADIDDRCVEVLTNALLKENSSLKKLSLSQNEDITGDGWRTFAAALRDPNSSLEALYIAETSINDEGAAEILNALADNSMLKSLNLFYNDRVSYAGWQIFFNRFNALGRNVSCALEEVNLGENNIDDGIAVALANAFANLSTLKVLRLDDNKSIETAGWLAISNLLQIRKASLVEVDLNMNEIDDEAAVSIATALANSPSLRILDLSYNQQIGSVGWRALGTCFRSSAIEKLDLGSNSINNEIAFYLANALCRLPTLKSLKLVDLSNITAIGWTAVLAVLSNPNSALAVLKLSMNNIDDDGAVAFANSLANNRTLKTLDIDVGWMAFSRLVCDSSSIMATISSNHTLSQVCEQQNAIFPTDTVYNLHLNKNDDKTEVTRHKIIRSHFQGENADIQLLLDMELKAMPHAFAWLGRNYVGHSVLYQLIRTMPSLVERYIIIDQLLSE